MNSNAIELTTSKFTVLFGINLRIIQDSYQKTP